MKKITIACCLFLFACGPNATGGDGDGDGDGDFPDGPSGEVTGRVWAPGNAPGMVTSGHEIPVAGARVTLTLQAPGPIPQEAYCERCVDDGDGTTYTDAAGNFSVSAPGATYWLTIQKGQFRLARQVNVTGNATIALTDEQTTMPSVHDPDNGQWIPRIALVPGAWDRLEDVLGKMGIGEVNARGAFQGDAAPTQVDLYSGDGGRDIPFPPPSNLDPAYQYTGSISDLFSDVETLSQYHIIFIPCGGDTEYSGSADEYGLLTNPAIRDNIREYVARGGKLYVTDWSSEWEDGVFPEFVVYDSVDTTKNSSISHGNGPNGYTSDAARAEDPGLNAWLDLQSGPKADGSSGAFDANSLEVHGNWNRIAGTPEVVVGQDDQGADVIERAHAWVNGDWGNGEGPVHPLTVTFEPAGCGRVMYSTYHTTEGAHPGLVPQERVLLYLIMEIGVCKEGPIVE